MKSHNNHTGHKSWKYDLPEDGEHIPNKQEAKLLRRLMSETGNTEEEIRDIPKYRRMLAEAQKSPQKGHGFSWKTRFRRR